MQTQKRKKILFIITRLHPFGGAQRFLLELLQNLDSAKYEAMVATGGDKETGNFGPFQALSAAKNIPLKALKWLRRNISPLNDYRAYREIRQLLAQEKPDTLFLLSSKAGFLGSFTARQLLATNYSLQTRIIYRIGGWAFNDPRSWLSRQLYIWAEKISAHWKNIIVVNSEHDAKQAEELGIHPREKLVTIYNGINPASLNFLNKNEARQHLVQITPSLRHSVTPSLWIGCIANFYKTKGLSYLIEAMANIHKTNPDVKLVMIGDGRERESLAHKVERLGLKEHVFLAGHLPDARMYLKAFDLFVLPSLKEGFPWALIEAMAAEIPVVATCIGAVPEIIDNGKNGLMVEPGGRTALAEAIKKLLEDEKLRSELARQGKETVENNFRLTDMIKEIEKLL